MHIFKIKLSLVILLIVTMGTSCNKLLDIHPKDRLEDEQIFNSVENFESAVLGVYAGLNYEYNLLIGSIFADEARISKDNMGVNGYASYLYRWGYSADDEIIFDAWKSGYESVYRINTLLENSHRLDEKEDAQKIKQLEFELRGLRAFLHFSLHQIYGQYDLLDGKTIPYITQTDINGKPSRISTTAFYDLAWKDLEAALTSEKLPSEKDRLNKDALQAFAARFFLYKKDYAKAIAYGESLTANYQLASGESYLSIWDDRSNDEVIFKLKRNQANEIRPNTLWRNYGSGKTMFYPSHKFLELLEEEDGDRHTLFENDDNDDDDEDFAPIGKYPGNSYASNINDVKVFRLSEIYLILAEAYSQSNTPNEQKASQWINKLRKVRDIDPILGPLTLSDILQERMIELSFEGHRYFDLKRLGETILRNSEDLALDTDKSRLDPSDPLYWIPIPFKEVQVNPNIK